MSQDAVIVAYQRSPFTPAHKGALAKTRPDDMAAEVVKSLLSQGNIDPKTIEDLILGCAFPEGEQGFNVARIIGFLAGVPNSTAAMTLNRFCGSSMQAIHIAAGNIATGSGEVFLCGGVESMTRIPMGGYNPMPHPKLYQDYPQAFMGMGMTAENVAKQFKLSRKEQEEFALTSQQKAAQAIKDGKLKDEIIPVDGVDQDGCPRPETTLEGMADLNPAFDAKGSVTAATSSPLTDGAAFTLVTSEEYADKHGLTKLARIKSMAVAGCEPETMGLGPIGASKKAMERAGVTMKDIDIIELNEAFAAQAIPCIRELGMDESKVNLDGGAIALGHPLGATGARITGKAASLLVREKKQLALATQCIGGGQGIATILEAC